MGEFRLLYYTCFVQNSPHETDKECRFAKNLKSLWKQT